MAKSACLRQKSLNQFAEKIQPLNPIIFREFSQNDAIVAEALAPKAALHTKKVVDFCPRLTNGPLHASSMKQRTVNRDVHMFGITQSIYEKKETNDTIKYKICVG
ncbi:hypothetical protein ACK6D9_19115 [Hoeflea sp. Naph1]|uniref:hypothetical protein n=1 Tax=Hoeflea sp. Naph1 TaxID=3388653 RepID=UPI00398FF1ED